MEQEGLIRRLPSQPSTREVTGRVNCGMPEVSVT